MPFDFKQGTFLIRAGENFEQTIIYRKDSLQIEHYQNRIDTLMIHWKNNFSYTLKMLHPKTKLDKKTVRVRIVKVYRGGYDFTAKMENSNFEQKGRIKKIAD